MSDNYKVGPGDEASGNGSTLHGRKEVRSSEVTGALPIIGPKMNGEHNHSGSHDFDDLLQSLRELFEHDRQIASQSDATRCGICYLHFPVSDLLYREEGFYVCPRCTQSLGNQHVSMLRKQQKLL